MKLFEGNEGILGARWFSGFFYLEGQEYVCYLREHASKRAKWLSRSFFIFRIKTGAHFGWNFQKFSIKIVRKKGFENFWVGGNCSPAPYLRTAMIKSLKKQILAFLIPVGNSCLCMPNVSHLKTKILVKFYWMHKV